MLLNDTYAAPSACRRHCTPSERHPTSLEQAVAVPVLLSERRLYLRQKDAPLQCRISDVRSLCRLGYQLRLLLLQQRQPVRIIASVQVPCFMRHD